MVWVDAEYAGPLAVLSAWLTALLPWNITYSSLADSGWVLFVRFPFAELQYTAGFSDDVDGFAARSVFRAISLQSGLGLETATFVWGASALVVLVGLGFSVVYYFNETRLEAAPIHPVRIMGGLLGLAAAGFAVATGFVWTGGFGGVPIPIGVVLMALLATVLLRATVTPAADHDATGGVDH